MSNAARGRRHYRVAQREVENKKAMEDAYIGRHVVDVKYVGLAFAFVMLVFVKGLIIGHALSNRD